MFDWDSRLFGAGFDREFEGMIPCSEALGSATLQTLTHSPLSSSFLGLSYRILNINHKEELLRGLWVNPKPLNP